MLLIELVLKSDNLEALTTVLTSIDWTLTNHVENLLMRVRIVLNTWSHTNDDSPRGVRCENENWIVNSTELRVHSRLHLVPLMKIECIVSYGCSKGHGGISMETISLRHLGLIVVSTNLSHGLNMLQRDIESLLHSFKH